MSISDRKAACLGQTEKLQLCLSSIAINILSLALPIVTLQVYDRILPNPGSGTLFVLVTGLCIAILLEALLRIARAWVMGWAGARYEQTLCTSGFSKFLDADTMHSNTEEGSAVFIHRMSAISRLKDFNNGYVMVTITELAAVPVFLGVIYYVSGSLVLIPLALMAIFTALSAVQGLKIRQMLERRDAADDKRYEFLMDSMRGIHSIKAFALENLMSRRYEALQEKSGRIGFHAADISTQSFNTGTMLAHIMMAMTVVAGASLVLAGSMTTGALIAALQLSGRLMQPAQRALSLWIRYQDYRLSQKKADDIFDLPALHAAEKQTAPAATGLLDIRNLSYGPLLKDISLELKAGEAICIHGDLGAGRSTLLEVIAGLHAPDSGEVIVDGMDISAFKPEDLVRHVGYLAPDTIVFRGSIRENITRFGSVPEATAQEVARLLHVDRDVARLPDGFDTPLQPHAMDHVPPGLRQRIALTRALALHPKIILFDEADKALDKYGYNLVHSLLAKLSRKTAMIIVSEDANIRTIATRHYLLQDGHLNEQKPPQETSPVTTTGQRTDKRKAS